VDGQEARRITVYLQNSLYLDYEGISIVDIGGDAKSLVVALSHGTLQVFSWQGQVGGAAIARRISDLDGEARRPCLHTYTHPCAQTHLPAQLLSLLQLRGQSNPLAVGDGARHRLHRRTTSNTAAWAASAGKGGDAAASETAGAAGAAGPLDPRSSSDSNVGVPLHGSPPATGGLAEAPVPLPPHRAPLPSLVVSSPPRPPLPPIITGRRRTSSSHSEDTLGKLPDLFSPSTHRDPSLPPPTPMLLGETSVRSMQYLASARLLAVVLGDGRCALCRTSEGGIHPVDQVRKG
jgi:hypothetical protein